MKVEERIVQEYLHRISSDVVYEPDGKIPPDFKLNQIIAVEVRRLNKNIIIGKRRNGLEQARCRLEKGLAEVLEEFNSPIPIDSFRIKLRMARPIPKISKIKSLVKKELRHFLENKPETPFEMKLAKNVSIILSKDRRKSSRVFHIAVFTDKDSCGWIGEDYLENIYLCIQEKTERIQKYKPRYSEWWLVLVDYLAGGIREPEKTFVIQNIKIGPEWKKLVVIHRETKKEILKIGSSDLFAD